jgi:hypothetical protein
MDLRTLDVMNAPQPIVWALLVPDTGDAIEMELLPTLPTMTYLVHAEIVTVIRLSVAGQSIDVILDTEAACHDGVPNWRATQLASAYGWAGDGLLGPALFVGVDAEGDPADLPTSLVYLYRQMTGQAVLRGPIPEGA